MEIGHLKMNNPLDSLLAGELKNDERVLQAKKLLLEAVHETQKKIKEVRPPNPERKKTYQELVEALSGHRGGKLYYPFVGSGIGNGALVELMDGSIKYDFISGIGVHYWGHSHQDLIESGIDAAISDTIMQGNLQQNFDTIILLNLLQKASGIDHCFLCSSGVIANENGLKLAFQKNYPAKRVLAFERCFMGRTLAMSQVTDKPAYRQGLPHTLAVDYIPFFDSTDPEGSTKRAVDTLTKLIKRYPGEYAAMCFELVQGEGGFYFGTYEFYSALMRVLKKEGIAVFIDEVQTFGRTPKLFAFQYFGLEKFVDIVTIGKLSQVCATFFIKEFAPKPGLLSQTFTASTSAIRAATTIVHNLLENNFFGEDGKIAFIHRYFEEKLNELVQKHPEKICGPYGIGAMIAFTVFKGNKAKTMQFAEDLYNAGVISFIAGQEPTRLRFLVPAGIITTKDIDQVIEIMNTVLSKSSI